MSLQKANTVTCRIQQDNRMQSLQCNVQKHDQQKHTYMHGHGQTQRVAIVNASLENNDKDKIPVYCYSLHTSQHAAMNATLYNIKTMRLSLKNILTT